MRRRVCDLFFFSFPADFFAIPNCALGGGGGRKSGVYLGPFAEGRRGGFGAGGGGCEVAGWDSEWEDGES